MRKDAPIISCFHLQVNDPSRNRAALSDVCIEIGRGAWAEIVGPAASGKSLLFAVLSLRAAASTGKLVMGGRNLDRASTADIAEVRRMIGSCAEDVILLNDRTVVENLVVPFVVRGEPRLALSHAENILARLELSYLRDIPVKELSRQERICVGVMRAIVGEPPLIIIDSALDQLEPRYANPLLNELKACHLSGASVLLFGRDYTENSRRGGRYRMEDGVLTSLEMPVLVDTAASIAGGAK